MRRLLHLVTVIGFVFFISLACGPSEEERRQAALKEQQRIEAEQAAAAELQKKREEKKRARSERAAADYRAWMDQMVADLASKPRYYQTLKSVSVEGDTLVLGTSDKSRDEAVKLCNFTLAGWWDKDKHGIHEVRVVLEGPRPTLAKSVKLDTGAKVCR